ncbi:protein of unknown function [Paraburkholderia kururiensis]
MFSAPTTTSPALPAMPDRKDRVPLVLSLAAGAWVLLVREGDCEFVENCDEFEAF